MITYSEYRKAAEIVAQYKKEQSVNPEVTLDQIFDSGYMSCRLYNILRNMGYKRCIKLKDMKGLNYNELRRTRNIGKKTMQEAEDIFNSVGLEFDYT
jgi:DNA-directed RNA polymerase alpha subunit